ncbi:MAG: glycosyltransferase family 2 protein [Candidatus Curtissbacteria bacterium]|nr:glycosyltransferase family 2 protein [Candidatus Curtissbacteria bacterium]
MDVSFIIVNWNTKKLLEQAIASLYKYATGFTFEIIVVDNASEDGSPGMVSKKFPKVKLIKNSDNVGFAKGNNVGIKAACGEFIFLFNSDAYLINDSIANLVKRAREIPNLGAIAPQILNEDRTIQQSVGFMPDLARVILWMSFIDDLPFGDYLKPYHVDHARFYKRERRVDWLTGAAFMIPRKVIAKVGPLDANIFMYGEDVDWCLRIKKAGFEIYYSPVAKLVHIGRGSAGKISKNAILGEYKGLIYVYAKHKSKFSLQMLRLLLKIGALARIIIFSVLGRKETAKFYVEALKMA